MSPISIRRNKGFTFIELIIAVTIFSIIAVSIYATFSAGVRFWMKSNPVIEKNRETRLFFDMISKDLTAAVRNIYEPDKSFDGQPQAMSFMTLIDAAGKDEPLHAELATVAYRYDEGSKSVQRVAAGAAEGYDIELAKPLVIAENVDKDSFGFAYCYESEAEISGYLWKDAWEDPKAIPKGVRVKLGEFTKTVFVPTGELGKEK